ncbi:MAG: 16S rRNA (cytosine(1402)-N(4))-methyltransferase RsmH [Bacteroidia bacterium]|nr:16S rRNA (cytosine(1402)-N(4))-methyltransferase RsmH [Bacteroidia bacterium]MCF8426906.1 16S rRNA (cytosine(1402)-N(4))-methyltransferase RsmH [Bacteroidia bacterium]MCF8447528.1 16S rRNA (cytosine(1402)-N(4))-methyltransferase RsmH [Bacteroidia bacterium]
MENKYHAPVMLKECLEGLAINPSGRYVDVTFGGGGHSRAILNALGKDGILIAFDQDEDAKANLPNDKRLVFIDQNFEFIGNHLRYQELLPVDGILADLGVSSHQFDEADRGFSFRFDEADLDMRMDTSSGSSAAVVLNEYSEKQLADIFYQYGELNQSKGLARDIILYRTVQAIKTVGHLKEALKKYTPKFGDYKFFAQVFQALRIEVNREMEVLKSFLSQVPEVLKPEGRLVVMSYHSLEDRLVKNFIASGNFNGELDKDFYGNLNRPMEAINRKVVTASDEELEINPRSRSAKLRIAEKAS